MTARAVTALGALGLVIFAGCSTSPGRVLVAVGSDYDVPADLAALVVRVAGPEGVEEQRPFHLVAMGMNDPAAARFSIPLSFVVVPRGEDSNRSARVTIEGYDVDGAPQPVVVARRNVNGFIEGKTVFLPIFLRQDCNGVRCDDPDTTCEHGVCVDAQRNASELDVLADETAATRRTQELADASAVDGGTPIDGGGVPDAGARLDSGGVSLDAGMVDAHVDPTDAAVSGAWALGDDDDQTLNAVALALDGSGDAFVVGSYLKLIHPGVTMASDEDAYVARVRPDGSVMWIHTLNTTGLDLFRGIAEQPDQTNVFVVGLKEGTGTGGWDSPLPDPSIVPGYVWAALDPLTGDFHWRSVMPATPSMESLDLASVGPAAAAQMNLFFATGRADMATFDVFGSLMPVDRGFVAAFHPSGMFDGTSQVAQMNAFTDLPRHDLALDSRLNAIAVEYDMTTLLNHVYVGGYEIVGGLRNVYVARIDFPDTDVPTVVWEQHGLFTPTSGDDVRGIAVRNGVVYFAGTHVNTAPGALVGALDARDGTLLDMQSYSTTMGATSTNALAIDQDGRVWVAGDYIGPLDLGGGVVAPAASDADMFLAAYEPLGGSALELFTYPGVNLDSIRTLAFDATRRAGYFGGVVYTPYGFAGMAPIGVGMANDACVVSFRY